MKRLNSKVALVTGGGSGIGEAICMRYAEEGAIVIISDINLDAAQQVAKTITESGGKVCAKQQDVTDPEQWSSLINEVIIEYGHLDILVNNACICILDNIENETPDDWKETLSVNWSSVFLGTQAVIKTMENEGGVVINTSSIERIIEEPMYPVYNEDKKCIQILVRSDTLHSTENDHQIRINTMYPGFIETPLLANAVDALEEEKGIVFSKHVIDSIPMKRMETLKEIANRCLFLASDEPSYMTGSKLVVNDNYTVH